MDSVELMRPLAEDKGIELKSEVDEGLPPIYASRDRLRQVITNLLSNGIKFTPAGGVVAVKAENGTDLVQVEVMDTGVGIPAEELPKIFDDFYRGLSSADKGAGLGLSIAKRIIEAHGGKIWAVSPCRGSDSGSEFIFTLPKNS
jgi:signal transduction histidine kinase